MFILHVLCFECLSVHFKTVKLWSIPPIAPGGMSALRKGQAIKMTKKKIAKRQMVKLS